MLFPESWLREFCDPKLTTVELADLLTMSGMEVESLEPVAPPFSKVVVAMVLSVERHPGAGVEFVVTGAHDAHGDDQIDRDEEEHRRDGPQGRPRAGREFLQHGYLCMPPPRAAGVAGAGAAGATLAAKGACGTGRFQRMSEPSRCR